MLYSYQSQYPRPLPFRITLSSGQTRTDPSTFTAEEIADAGYTLAPDKPVVSYPEYVRWNGTDWDIFEQPIETVKSEKKQQIATKRYQEETNHPSLDTTRESQAMINGVWSASQINPNLIVNFKQKDGTWVQADANTINIIAIAVIEHVQACFDNEKTLNDAVDLANTSSEVVAIDISVGWPDYSEPQSNTV
jgi:hypothetical protein